jgi:hypothetical protein
MEKTEKNMQKEEFLKIQRFKKLVEQAEKLSGSVLPNSITMEEIVAEVLIVRSQNYKAK